MDTKQIGHWALRGFLALAFGAAGAAKLAGAPPMVLIFEDIGVGQWFRLVTGGIEVAGALMLLRLQSVFWGAALLACTMVGAVLTHLVVIGGSPVPALVLLIAALVLAWMNRPGNRQTPASA